MNLQKLVRFESRERKHIAKPSRAMQNFVVFVCDRDIESSISVKIWIAH